MFTTPSVTSQLNTSATPKPTTTTAVPALLMRISFCLFVSILFGCSDDCVKSQQLTFEHRTLDSLARDYFIYKVEKNAIGVVVLSRHGAGRTAIKFSQLKMVIPSSNCSNLYEYSTGHLFILLNGTENVMTSFANCATCCNNDMAEPWNPEQISVLLEGDSLFPSCFEDYISVPNSTRPAQRFQQRQ